MSMLSTTRHDLLVAMAITIPLLAACGGGSSNGNGDDNGDDTASDGDTLPALAGLDSDAGNHDLLYYYTTENQQGLYAATPREGGGSPDTDLVDEEAEGVVDVSAYRADEFIAFFGGNWQSGNLTIEDWAVDQVLYPRKGDDLLDPAEYYRVDTDPAGGLPSPERVSAETGLGMAGAATLRRFAEYNYVDGDAAGMVYFDSSSFDNEGWRRVHLGDEATDSPDSFSDDHQMVATVPDLEAGTPGGYLVLDDDTLVRVDADLDEIGTPEHASAPVTDVDVGWMVRHLNDVDGGAYIALQFDVDDAPWELWVYQGAGDSSEVGSLSPVTDAGGETLELRGSLFPGQPQTPGDEGVATAGGATYIGLELGEDADPTLVRLEGDNWEILDEAPDVPGGILGSIPFVIHADGHIVWAAGEREPVVAVDPDNGNKVVLDANDNGELSTTVPAARDGWVFYTREDSVVGPDVEVAVAAQVDGSNRIELNDARWIGASIDGLSAGVEFQPRPSEMFLVRQPGSDDASLAALEAADPEAGLVDLGDLPGSADDARMFGAAPGPHRLVQLVDTQTSPDLHWVAYVDTRQEGSLERLTFTGTTDDDGTGEAASEPLRHF